MKRNISLLLLLSCSVYIFSQIPSDSMYFGQTPPGNTPVIFALGKISKADRYEHDICFSPNGDEVFFTISQSNWSSFSILHSKWDVNKWTTPVTADFSKQYQNAEVIFSPDGKSVLFASSRTPGSLPWDFGIFRINKSETGWSAPNEIGIKTLQPSSNDGNWHPAITNDSTVYFSSYNSSSYDIYCSKIKNGTYSGFEKLGNNINSSSNDWYPWISPDNSYLIFSSNRPGGFGGDDLYVSFKNNDGSWSAPINLGKTINSAKNESSPRVTSDKKHFFFTRRLEGNWDGDFYWVSAEFINTLNPTSVDLFNKPDIQVFPNPTKDKIIVSLATLTYKSAYAEITDIAGRRIMANKFDNTSSTTFHLMGNPKGIYLLNMNIDGKIINKKIYLE